VALRSVLAEEQAGERPARRGRSPPPPVPEMLEAKTNEKKTLARGITVRRSERPGQPPRVNDDIVFVGGRGPVSTTRERRAQQRVSQWQHVI